MKKVPYLARSVTLWLITCFVLLNATSSMGESVRNVPETFAPFDLSRSDATIRVDIKVKEHRVYQFFLNVYYKGRIEEEKILEIVGDGSRYSDGRYGRPGVVTSIHLKIIDRSGSLIVDDIRNVQGVDSHSFSGARDGYYSRYIYGVELRPGIYHVEVDNVKAVPDFSGISCAVHIGWHPNTEPLSD